MIALWDFREKPWTWDFFTWLVIVREHGATGVDFRMKGARSTKWSMEESLKRFRNYLEPGPRELAGMTVSVDGDGIETGLIHSMRDVPATFARLKLRDPQSFFIDYTVTIRNTFHRPARNSDQAVWREFARRIGAVIIEDSADRPISLRERYSLYAGARMNYGVPNGPVSTIWYTPYPLCMLSDPANNMNNKSWGGHGIRPGDRMPWLLPNQHLVWECASVDRLLELHKTFAC